MNITKKEIENSFLVMTFPNALLHTKKKKNSYSSFKEQYCFSTLKKTKNTLSIFASLQCNSAQHFVCLPSRISNRNTREGFYRSNFPFFLTSSQNISTNFPISHLPYPFVVCNGFRAISSYGQAVVGLESSYALHWNICIYFYFRWFHNSGSFS